MATSLTSASSSGAPITFSGSSTFSSSFQQVIQRAVALADAPIQLEQNAVTDLANQQGTLNQLDSTFTGLQAALGSISAAATGESSVQVSDQSTLTASAATGALPGTYTVQVDNMGSSTTAMSTSGLITVADPATQNLSSASSFTLTVNGTTSTITPASSGLSSLAAALNAGNYGVQATIVNMGSSSSPDYRLSVTSKSLAPDTIQLNDGSTNLLSTLATGQNVEYAVNGSSTDISSSTTKITLSPGLTLNLLRATRTPVTVTVGPNSASISNAISNFATAYNNAVNAVQQQVGQSGGALAGQSVVYEMSNVLQSLSEYGTPGSGSQSVASLADLGLTVDETGQMSFDASRFSAAPISAIQSFLGATTTSGYLLSATNQLNALTDSTTGAFRTGAANLQSQITQKDADISNRQAQVTQMQSNLQKQLAASDAAIATLQSQASYYQQLFQATYGNGTTSHG